MNKFGHKENFDIEIHIEGREEPFVLDSVNRFDIEAHNDDQFNRFYISDSLVNVDFINAVLGGMFANRFCKLVCKSTFRGLDGADHPIEMTVKGAVLVTYTFNGTAQTPSNPRIVFEADYFNNEMKSNTSIVV